MRRESDRWVWLRHVALLAAFMPAGAAFAQDKKEEKKKEPPRVIMAVPPVVSPGKTETLKLRGIGLEQATAVRFADAKTAPAVQIRSKGKAEVPKGLEAPQAGDSQVEIEVVLPADVAAGTLEIAVETPDGTTKPYALTVVATESLVPEKESNGGFKNAQEIAVGKTVSGVIGEEKDVDVFRIIGKAGQVVSADVRAAHHGSTLDAVLTLHDSRGHVLATADDDGEARDPMLTFKLPADGVYYLSLIDSLDRGGMTYGYLMSAQPR